MKILKARRHCPHRNSEDENLLIIRGTVIDQSPDKPLQDADSHGDELIFHCEIVS